MEYIPLHCLTHGTHLLSCTITSQIANFCKEHDYKSVALTDINSVSQCVDYHRAMKKAGKKPILGCHLKLENDLEFILLCKNKDGWKNLLYLLYKLNKRNLQSNKYSLLEDIKIDIDYDGLICIAYEYSENYCDLIKPFFKKEQFFYAYDKSYHTKPPFADESQVVPITPNFCLTKDDVHKLRVVAYKDKSNREHDLFKSEHYYVPTAQELLDKGYSKKSLENTVTIYNMIEEFEIEKPQKLPSFQIPKTYSSENEYLRHLSKSRLEEKGLHTNPEYIKRLNFELGEIERGGMAGYFLVIQDLLNHLRNHPKRYINGVGRGSAGGCLVSFVNNIVTCDPIKYGLLFERFYSPDRGSLPDVDIDLSTEAREEAIRFMQDKYGKDYFLHVCTFNKIKGKEALSVALNYHKVPFMEQKTITKCLPEESFVAPQLNDQKNQFGNKSLTLYQLHRELRHKDDNEPKPMSRWCQLVEIDDAGVYKLEGELADAFDDAIRIDDIYANRGMHACAYCLSDQPLYKSTHIGYDDKSNELILNTEMDACESLGLVKIDFLGIKLLDRIQETREIVQGRQNRVLENPYKE